MADEYLKDKPALRDSERDTAILAAVSDETLTGDTRKITVSDLMEHLHAENRALIQMTDTVLYEETTQNAGARDDDFGTVYQLDFVNGVSGERYNFDDYSFFEVYLNTHADAVNEWASFFVSGASLQNATTTAPYRLYTNFSYYGRIVTQFAVATDRTSFRLGGYDPESNRQSLGEYVWKIVGFKLEITLTSLEG